jgi:hypothetical protein
LGGSWRCAALFCSAAIALFASGAVCAEEWNVVLNGKAIHVGASREWNEDNWGLGFEREFGVRSRWVKAAFANGFRDSGDGMSYMAGVSIKRRFPMRSTVRGLYFDVGVAGFLMTREDVHDNRPFPGVLPTMTVGIRNFGLNLSYIPGRFADEVTNSKSADPGMDGIFFIQAKFAPRILGFGHARRETR